MIGDPVDNTTKPSGSLTWIGSAWMGTHRVMFYNDTPTGYYVTHSALSPAHMVSAFTKSGECLAHGNKPEDIEHWCEEHFLHGNR